MGACYLPRATLRTFVRESLREQIAIADEDFDSLYPAQVQRMSSVHWTPVMVALRAAALLSPEPGMRLLDVGAGPGKLCCIAALASGSIWHGVERDHVLVGTANATAQLLEVDHRARFTVGDMTSVRWADFDGLYFYNPFEAAMFHASIDEHAARARFVEEIAQTEQRLAELPTGMRVVTYHGFGGDMPTSYVLEATEAIGSDQLALWVKRRVTA